MEYWWRPFLLFIHRLENAYLIYDISKYVMTTFINFKNKKVKVKKSNKIFYSWLACHAVSKIKSKYIEFFHWNINELTFSIAVLYLAAWDMLYVGWCRAYPRQNKSKFETKYRFPCTAPPMNASELFDDWCE